MSVLNQLRELLSSATITATTKGNVIPLANATVHLPDALTIGLQETAQGYDVSLNPAVQVSNGPCGLGARIKTLEIIGDAVFADVNVAFGITKRFKVVEVTE